MHKQRDRTENALSVINQTNEFAQRRLPAQIQHTVERGMIVMFFTDLNEEDFSSKLIDDRLPAAEMPPLDCIIQFAARDDNPIRGLKAGDLLDQRRHRPFGGREMNIS